MDEMEKLKHLLEHWAEHNEEHARGYRDWAAKAKTANKPEASKLLLEIAAGTEKLNGLLKRAKESI